MNTAKCLFIGGPLDGQRRDVEDGMPGTQVSVLIRTQPGICEFGGDCDQIEAGQVFTYKREFVRGGDRTLVPVFIPRDSHFIDAFQRLMDGYRPGDAFEAEARTTAAFPMEDQKFYGTVTEHMKKTGERPTVIVVVQPRMGE